jgi:flagellar biogenesis protein FliO
VTDTLQPVLAVLLVLALLGGTLYFLRKRGLAVFAAGMPSLGRKGANTRQLKVVERLALGPHHALHLVSIGETLVVISTSPGSCQAIDAPAMAAGREGSGR